MSNKIILIQWEGHTKEAYPFEKETLEKIITYFDNIVEIELIDFHDGRDQELPFPVSQEYIEVKKGGEK